MAMDDYQPLMNASPFATSPGATESLRGLANQMNQFRSQSRLGMLDTQIGGPRRRPADAPDVSFNAPVAPAASGRGADIFRSLAKKIASDPEAAAKFEATGNPQQDLPQIADQLRADFGSYIGSTYGMK